MEVHKPAQEMFVPDSLKRFDLDFDYSVFENPYKDASEEDEKNLILCDAHIFWR